MLADCHVHPGAGPNWDAATLDALAGADLIVTLGDMGESRGLDPLAAIAPVIGVHGADDEDDPRTAPAARKLRLGGVLVGCVFDPKRVALADRSDPFTPSVTWPARAADVFGEPIQMLLYASTHRPHIAEIEGVRVVNPGSALLPADGSKPSIAILKIEDGKLTARIVEIAR